MLTRQKLLVRLKKLVRDFEGYQKEKFFPFLLMFSGQKDHPRFQEALAIAAYYVENAWVFGERAQALASFLRKALKKFEEEIPHWTDYADKTPLPLPTYLKVWADVFH